MNLFKILKDNVPASLRDAAARISSNRVQSYYILILIYMFCVFFLTTEVIRMIRTGDYKFSGDISNIFIYLLAHHVIFSGVSKNSKSEPSGNNVQCDPAIEKIQDAEQNQDQITINSDPK